MKNKCPLVSIVDDDESVRESVPDLLKEFGFAAQAISLQRRASKVNCDESHGTHPSRAVSYLFRSIALGVVSAGKSPKTNWIAFNIISASAGVSNNVGVCPMAQLKTRP